MVSRAAGMDLDIFFAETPNLSPCRRPLGSARSQLIDEPVYQTQRVSADRSS